MTSMLPDDMLTSYEKTRSKSYVQSRSFQTKFDSCEVTTEN